MTRGDHSWGLILAHDDHLMGIKAVGPISAGVEIVGPGAVQRDGWGLISDQDFPKAQNAIGHNRLASMGRVSLVNTHPFLSPDGEWAMGHNGHVGGLIPYDAEHFTPQGETDSEQVLYHYLTRLAEGKTIPEALRECMRLQGRTNLMLLRRDGLIACLSSDALYRYDGPDWVAYASEPVDVPSLSVKKRDPKWTSIARGCVETVKDGKVLSSERVIDEFPRPTIGYGWNRYPVGWARDDPSQQTFAARSGRLPLSFNCPDCPDRKFVSSSALLQHRRAKHERRGGARVTFDCAKCDEAFEEDVDLRQHFLETHQASPAPTGGAGLQDCPAGCGLFIRPENFRLHFEETHAAPKTRYQGIWCDTCELNFQDIRDYRRHLLGHEEEGGKADAVEVA